MKKIGFKKIMFLILMMSLVIVAGCSNDNEGGNAEEGGGTTGIIPLYSPGVGGTNYIISTGIGKIVGDSGELPDATLSTESTSGTTEIIKNVSDSFERERPAFGTPASDIVTRMYEGDWEPLPGEYTELRAVGRISYAASHIVAPANSDINTLADIEGKNIGIAPQGSSPYNFMSGLLEEGYGFIDGEDYSAIPMGNPDIQDGIKNGSLDVGVLTGSIPASLVTELANTEDVKLIPIEEDILNDYLESYPYYSSIQVEGGVYPGQDEDITVGIFQTMLMTHEATDEDLVYTVIKEVWENTEELEKIYPAFSLDEDNVLDGIEIPLHPGAEKFYQEIGVIEE